MVKATSDKGRGLAVGEKWTDKNPVFGEKHFVVVRVGEDGVEVEAVLSRRRRTVSREALALPEGWVRGW